MQRKAIKIKFTDGSFHCFWLTEQVSYASKNQYCRKPVKASLWWAELGDRLFVGGKVKEIKSYESIDG